MPGTIVVKVGTSTLTDAGGGLDRDYLHSLAGQLAAAAAGGRRVVLVSSGAVRAGLDLLGWGPRPRTLPLRQAAAAVGQGRLMALYSDAFAAHGIPVGQVLLTRQLAADRASYLNARNTLTTLLDRGVIPVINENDTVAVEELQFGDNDTLAALVAALVDARLLLLLTNVDGLLDSAGNLVRHVHEVDGPLRAAAGGAGAHGSGGMITKLQAAEIAGAAGARTVIARGRPAETIRRILAGEEVGTVFHPTHPRLRGRKHWLAYGTRPRGSVTVNPCAVRVLVEEHRSLLPAGVVAVQGPFDRGESVSVLDDAGNEFARGLASCDWRDAERVKGAHTARLPEILGRSGPEEIIHRDNLVILPAALRLSPSPATG